MSIAVDLRNALVLDATVAASVGTRVYPGRLPQGATMPAITYNRISTVRDASHSGAGLAWARFQLDCWAETYGAADTLATAVIALFHAKRGRMAGQATLVDNDVDDKDPDANLYRRIVDVLIYFEE